MSEDRSLLTIRSLSKCFANLQALDNVDLDFRASQMVALIGPNGSGKSTLLNCLSGGLQPDRGNMMFRGRPYFPMGTGAARQMGIKLVAQELDFFPDLTVRQNFALRCPRPELPPAQDDLAGDALTPMSQLPAAVVQRAILDAELSSPTAILCLDEPSALLNGTDARNLFSKLQATRASGTLVIAATHRPADFGWFDRWIFMQDGKVEADVNTLDAAHDRYQNRGHLHTATERLPYAGREGTQQSLQLLGTTFDIVSGSTLAFVSATAKALFLAAEKVRAALIQSGHRTVFIGPERRSDHLMVHRSLNEYASLWLGSRSGYRSCDGRLRQFGLRPGKNFWSEPLHVLSGGMQQKFLLALAFASHADFRIFCDPLRGLDDKSINTFSSALHGSQVDRTTNLVFTQDAQFASQIADTVYTITDNLTIIRTNTDAISPSSNMSLL